MLSQSSTVLPTTLRWHWWSVALAFALAGLATFAALHLMWRPAHALDWGLPTSVALVYVLGYSRINLQYNRRSDNHPILPSLGVCNALTLVRGLLVGLLAGFVVLPLPDGVWAFFPGLLYTAAAVTDLADGALARARGESTRLGAKLDVEMDSFGILIAVLLAVQAGQLPEPFVALGGLYYAYRIGISLRQRMGFVIHPLPQSRMRKRIGGAWGIYLCIILYPVFAPPATTVAGAILGGLLLASFVRDTWIASGLGRRYGSHQSIPDWLRKTGRVALRVAAALSALAIPVLHTDPSVFRSAMPLEYVPEFTVTLWGLLAIWFIAGVKSWLPASVAIAATAWAMTTGGWSLPHVLCMIVSLAIVVVGPKEAAPAAQHEEAATI